MAITDSIQTNAEGPKKVAADGVVVEQHSIQDLIAADRYLASKAAAARAGFPCRRMLARAPGATGGTGGTEASS